MRSRVDRIQRCLRYQRLKGHCACNLCLRFWDPWGRARYIAKIRENRASSEKCEIPRNMRYRETRMQLVSAMPAGRSVRHDRSTAFAARIDRQASGHRPVRESGSESSSSKNARRSRRLQAFRVCNLRDPRATFMRFGRILRKFGANATAAARPISSRISTTQQARSPNSPGPVVTVNTFDWRDTGNIASEACARSGSSAKKGSRPHPVMESRVPHVGRITGTSNLP